MSTYSLQVKWPGDSTFTNLTPQANRDYSYDLYSGGKDFKFVKNTFEIEVVYTSALALKVLSLTTSDIVPVTIDKDSVRLFTGYLIPIDGQGYSSWKRTTIPLTIQDPSLLLDTALTADLVYLDHWLSAPSATSYSILHKLMALASATVSFTPPNTGQGVRVGTNSFEPVTNNVLPLFLAKKGDNLLNILTNLLWQQGWRWWFDASGIAQFTPWVSTVGSAITFNVANENVIDGSFKIDKTNFLEDSVEVSFTTSAFYTDIGKTGVGWSAFKNNDVNQSVSLFIDGTTTEAPSSATTLTHFTIKAPTQAGSKDILAWGIPKIRFFITENIYHNHEFIGQQFNMVTSVLDDVYYSWWEWSKPRWVELDTSTLAVSFISIQPDYYSVTSAGMTISNFTSVNGIINFDLVTSDTSTIFGIMIPDLTATCQGDSDKSTSYGSRKTGPKKYTVELPTNKSQADNLASWIRQQLVNLSQVYTVKSYSNVTLGSGVTVDIGGVTASGFIFAKAYDDKSRIYTYRIKQLTAATTGTATITAQSIDSGDSVGFLVPDPSPLEYYLKPSVASLSGMPDGTLSPSKVSVSAFRRVGGGTGVPTTGWFKVWENNGASWNLVYQSSADEAALAYTPSVLARTGIRFEFYAPGGTTTLLDICTVMISGTSGIYPSDDALALRVTLDDMPEWPDNPTGTLYFPSMRSLPTINLYRETITQGPNYWRFTANATDPYFEIVLPSSCHGKLIVIKLRKISGSFTIIDSGYVANPGYSHLINITTFAPDWYQAWGAAAVGEWVTLIALVPTTYTDLTVFRLDIYQDSNLVWDLGGIYVGDCSYLANTKAIDISPSALQLSIQPGAIRKTSSAGFAVDTTFGGLFSTNENGLPFGSLPRTIDVLFLSTNPGTGYRMILTWGSQSSNSDVYVYHYGGQFIIDRHGGAAGFSSSGFLDGFWHRLSFVFDGTRVLVYIDGALKTTFNYNFSTLSGSGFALGYDPITSGRNFQGLLARPTIWGRALTASEISGLFSMSPVMAQGGVAATIATKAPGYLGVGYSDPSIADREDFYYNASVGSKRLRILKLSGWQDDSDPSHLMSAWSDILMVEGADTGGNSAAISVITNLVSKTVFAQSVTALALEFVNSLSSVKGSAYNPGDNRVFMGQDANGIFSLLFQTLMGTVSGQKVWGETFRVSGGLQTSKLKLIGDEYVAGRSFSNFGLNWNTANDTDANSFGVIGELPVAYGNGLLLYLRANGTSTVNVYQSLDNGLTTQASARFSFTAPASVWARAACYGGNARFLFAVDGYVYACDPGYTTASLVYTLASGTVASLEWTGSYFLINGKYSSPTGNSGSWTTIPTIQADGNGNCQKHTIMDATHIIGISGGTSIYMVDLAANTATYVGSTSGTDLTWVFSIAYLNGVLFVAGTNASSYSMWRSTNLGATSGAWTAVTPPITPTFAFLRAYDGFILMTNNYFRHFVSRDLGVTWTSLPWVNSGSLFDEMPSAVMIDNGSDLKRLLVFSCRGSSPYYYQAVFTDWLVAGAGIIEKGINVNGTYIKHSDGTLEQFSDNYIGDIATTTTTHTFPTAFVGTPIVSYSVYAFSNQFYSNDLQEPLMSSVSTSNFQMFWEETGGVTQSIGIHWRAIGRWR